ncbi:GNAT family N-acetyltransferase [Streptomyces sp. NPDC005574]|uniref:GNAT family N-acetyltransferase n=1 Tax=Streptomyces sp. NPDC005574 TaxID=3156891 RepID=UPI0033A26D8D
MTTNARVALVSPKCNAIYFRPLCRADEGLILQAANHLSPKSLYLRFCVGTPRIPDHYISLLNSIISGSGVVVGAFLAGGSLVGWAELVNTSSQKADMGILVVDPWQGQGIGGQLLENVMETAARQGMETVTADVLQENERAIRLLVSRKGIARHKSEGLINFHISVGQ